MKLNSILVKSTLVAALGGLLFGFDTAVIAGTTQALTAIYHLSAGSLGLTVSIALWGTIVGALLAGIPGDKYGRRDSLRLMGLFFLVSALGCAFAWSWYSLVTFRFVAGLGVGGASVLGPMYIAEISPARWRGRLVGLFQFNVVLGILVAYLSNYIVGLFDLGMLEWRWKLGVGAVPAAAFMLLLFAIPRTPRWLVKQRASEPLLRRKYWMPIFLAVSIAMFNQLSGINALLYYLNDIFARAGFSKVSSDLQAVAIGATNLLFTVVAMSVIDKLGRKTLLLVGSVGTAACLAGVSVIFFTNRHQEMLVWLLIGYIAFFAFSQGAVIWVYISEVFPTRVRAKGQALGSFTHWFMCALVSGTFPKMAESSGGYPFVFFSVMMVIQFFVVRRFASYYSPRRKPISGRLVPPDAARLPKAGSGTCAASPAACTTSS